MPDSKPKATKAQPPPFVTEEEKPRASAPSKKSAGRPPAMEKQLEQFFMTLGIMISPVNHFDSMVVVEMAEVNAKAWADLAQKNRRVKEYLEKMMETSAWGGVLMATAAIVVPVGMNHGVIPPTVPMPQEWPSPPVQQDYIAQVNAQRTAER